MGADLLFTYLLLGLVSGKQAIELHAGADIKAIQIVLGGQEIARMTQPPWRTDIDLGSELVPRKLEAVGFDANGNEVARISQLINLPAPRGEVEILREKDGVQLRAHNLEFAPVRSVKVTFDGAPLSVDSTFRAKFPETDWSRPHVIAAQMQFKNGLTAQREVVLEGATFSDTLESQLTQVMLTKSGNDDPPSLDGCLSIGGSPIEARPAEDRGAIVMFVRDPDPRDPIRSLRMPGAPRVLTTLAADTHAEILWPIAKRFALETESSLLFAHTKEFSNINVIALLLGHEAYRRDDVRRYGEAVAVAGLRALADGRRRAVVYVLNPKYPASRDDFDPRVVRRYLESIGVPLFVWSVDGPRPDLISTWGAVDDVSSPAQLSAAVLRLRRTLSDQRTVWVHADPLTALSVRADPKCGVDTAMR